MAEGIRIKHTTVTGPAILAIRDHAESRISPPYPGCNICGLPEGFGHEGYKTRHIDIDADGYAIVSEGVLEGLKHLADWGGFELQNVVSNPPGIKLEIGSNGQIKKTIIQKVQQDIAVLSKGKK